MNSYQSILSGEPILKDDYDDEDRDAVYEALRRRRKKTMLDRGIPELQEDDDQPITKGFL